MIDHYAILGVARNASSIEIREAYMKLARTSHPDKVKDRDERKKAEDAFKFVTAAYDTLSRERSRKEYTAKLPAEQAQDKGQGQSRTGSSEPQNGPSAAARQAAQKPIASSGPVNFDSLTLGIEAFKKKDYHTAVQLLNLAVSRDDKNAQAHGMLALALAKNPNWVRDAVSHMETAARLDLKNVSYQVELALMLNSQGLKLRARRAMEKAAALNPTHPDVTRGLQEIPLGQAQDSETPEAMTSETSRSLFDRLRKR